MPRARISTASIARCGPGAAYSPHYAHYRRRSPPPATKQALSGLACQAALRLVPPGPWAQCRIAWSVRFCRPGRCILIVEEATMLLLAAVCATMAKTCGGVPNTSSHTLDVPASMTHSGDLTYTVTCCNSACGAASGSSRLHTRWTMAYMARAARSIMPVLIAASSKAALQLHARPRPRLNSSMKRRFVLFAFKNLLALRSLVSVSVKTREISVAVCKEKPGRNSERNQPYATSADQNVVRPC